MYPFTEFRHISALQEHRFGKSGPDTSIPGVQSSSIRRTMAALASLARRPVGAHTRSSRGGLHINGRHRFIGHH